MENANEQPPQRWWRRIPFRKNPIVFSVIFAEGTLMNSLPRDGGEEHCFGRMQWYLGSLHGGNEVDNDYGNDQEEENIVILESTVA
ncbi:hypothetical protein RHSIM_Rhsim05G0033000 [Rhododendron simsii]|uniref:Uncharacterized protein n=1 Tax=Rhododendron simsii TaxID=118357 RepID=A0A834LQ29_RHOSS|nr:hypothetical protein RHSIM_Rhsim05G0033000 [Rhododendron simsii]